MIGKFKLFLAKACLLLTLISLCIVLVVNAVPLYHAVLVGTNTLAKHSLSWAEVAHDYRHLLLYLQLPWMHSLHFENFTLSPAGRLHFYEVKQWLLLNESILLVTGMMSLRFLGRMHRLRKIWQLQATLYWWRWLPFPILCLMGMNFNRFFVWFHHLLFRDKTWIFNPQMDSIILVLPPVFFLSCFLLFFVLYELCITGIIRLGKRELKGGRG